MGPSSNYRLYKFEVPLNDKIVEYRDFKPLPVTFIPENYELYLEKEYSASFRRYGV